MPMKRDNQKLYGGDWGEISRAAKERAGWRCECVGQCGVSHAEGRSGLRQGDLPLGRKRRVTLTTHHINAQPWDERPENLMALCEGCHLRLDKPLHQSRAHATRDRKKGMQKLFGVKEARKMPASKEDGKVPVFTIDSDARCPRCGRRGQVNGNMCSACLAKAIKAEIRKIREEFKMNARGQANERP